MRHILILAGALIVGGTAMAQLAERASATRAAAATVGRAEASPSAPRTVTLARDRRGHFRAEGRIEDARLDFMVDTGASLVALNETSAARAGVRIAPSDYTARAQTANGVVKAARVRLASIDIGGIRIRDVEAMVLHDAALSENLLGLSFLSKLKRFEYADGRLVLQR